MRILTGLLLSLAATAAHAGPLAVLKGVPCEDSTVSNRAVALKLLGQSGIEVSEPVFAAIASGKLGDHAEASQNADPKWIALLNRADTLARSDVKPEAGFAVTVGPNAPATGRAGALLNGTASWLFVSCTPAPPPVDRAGREDEAEGLIDDLIVAKSLDDADKGAAKRGFATLSYTADAKNDDEIISADVFVGFPGVETGLGPKHTLRPYLLYQRRTSVKDPLNDLSFGLSSRWWLGGPAFLKGPSGGGNALFLNGEYETDDEFDSELYRAELVWEPVWLDLCGHLTGDRNHFSCTPKLYVDMVDVQDAGEKKALQGANSFERFGASYAFLYWRDLGNGSKLRFHASYSLREPFGGGVGDAAVGAASVSFIPAGADFLSLGLEYTNGEDVTSLVRSETLKLSVGFRFGN